MRVASETTPFSVKEIEDLFLRRLVLDFDYIFLITLTSTRSLTYENAHKASFTILQSYTQVRAAHRVHHHLHPLPAHRAGTHVHRPVIAPAPGLVPVAAIVAAAPVIGAAVRRGVAVVAIRRRIAVHVGAVHAGNRPGPARGAGLIL